MIIDFGVQLVSLAGKPMVTPKNPRDALAGVANLLREMPARLRAGEDSEALAQDIEKGMAASYDDMTLGYVSATALASGADGNQQSQRNEPQPAEKMRRFALAMKLLKGGEQDISPGDSDLIQRCIVASYPQPEVSGQACQLLHDGMQAGKAEAKKA